MGHIYDIFKKNEEIPNYLLKMTFKIRLQICSLFIICGMDSLNTHNLCKWMQLCMWYGLMDRTQY